MNKDIERNATVIGPRTAKNKKAKIRKERGIPPYGIRLKISLSSIFALLSRLRRAAPWQDRAGYTLVFRSMPSSLLFQSVETPHVHVGLASPLRGSNVPRACRHQHQCRLPIREVTHHPRSPPDLTVYPFQRVVLPQQVPVFRRKGIAPKGLFSTRLRWRG